MLSPEIEQSIYQTTRPSGRLFWLYLIRSAMTLLGFPFVFLPLYCKYISLRYHIDEEGVGASWGVLFKKQVFLTYARIQDIHVSRSFLERWLGIGTVDIQTASGSASAELSITGIEFYDAMRDFLYSKMRGAKGEQPDGAASADSETEVLQLLQSIREEIPTVARRQAGGRWGEAG